jgi:hypothetical protein
VSGFLGWNSVGAPLFGAHAALGMRCPTCGHPYNGNAANAGLDCGGATASNWVWTGNTFYPPLQPAEPGIHWTRTGGKTWKVVIVR